MATCRICLEDADPEADLAPCACKGSARFVHRACLERWALLKTHDECEICKQPYTIKLPRRWLREETATVARFIGSFTLLVAMAFNVQYMRPDEPQFGIVVMHGLVVLQIIIIWILIHYNQHLTEWQRRMLQRDIPFIVTCVYGPQMIIDDLRGHGGWTLVKLGIMTQTGCAYDADVRVSAANALFIVLLGLMQFLRPF